MESVIYQLEVLKDKVQDAVFALTSCICQPSATIKVNGRSFKILRILGEGGFSFVYLAQDEHSGREFALKKIRCPTGQEGVKEAMREVEAYRRFRGNLQDIINSNSIHNSHLSEQDILTYFLGTCKGVSAMHNFRMAVPAAATSRGQTSGSKPPRPPSRQEHHDDEDSHDQTALLPEPEGDGEDGFSYHGRSSRGAPLPTRAPKVQRGVETVFDGDEELENLQQAAKDSPPGSTELVPYAHRDIKPANVMLSDDGTPVLMDFGSTIKARIHIENRNQALIQQDIAAEQSTMPYRAPELFDVKTGTTLDEKVDIWSLGCVLFALAFNHSPFETSQTTEQGGSMAMAVMNAQYKIPATSPYSEGLKDLINSCLKVNPAERPNIDQLVEKTDALLRTVR
ncbi:hypothetical protein FRC00_004527 [Tulasnella sp. 408]|nr:hypothetical protein FRC00_004527 [Tulasnella sp. 408]